MMMIITIMIIIISVAFWMSVAVSVKDSNLSATNSQVCVCYKKGNFEEKKIVKRVSWWKDTAETDRLLVIHYFLIKLDCGRKKKLFFCFFVFDFVLGGGKKNKNKKKKKKGWHVPMGLWPFLFSNTVS